jgi:hypothetical protein
MFLRRRNLLILQPHQKLGEPMKAIGVSGVWDERVHRLTALRRHLRRPRYGAILPKAVAAAPNPGKWTMPIDLR